MPPQIIEIPGVGEVEFPETMSEAEVSAAAKRLHDEANKGPIARGMENLQSGIANTVIGAVKGAAKTAIGAGEIMAPVLRQIPGVRDYVATPEEFDQAREFTEPTTTGQKIGQLTEQGLEYATGAGATRRAVTAVAPRVLGATLPAMAAEGASAAGVAALHGEDPTTAATLSAAFPLVGAVAAPIARGAKNLGVRFARAALKPTVTEMKQTAGASRAGIGATADRLARFIVERRITTPEKAQAIIDAAETEVQSLVGDQATDAATRAARYLQALERSAARQGLATDAVSAIRTAAEELKGGRMGMDVVTSTTRMQPSTVLGPDARPVMVPVTTQQTSRALRSNVPAAEALDSARASSAWATRRNWGELKGASVESAKAVERGQRDAVKAAVPASRPHFAEMAKAIKARDILQRMNFRQGNRDVVGLPSHVIAAGEIVRGRPPVMALAANWLRDNQLRAGIWADQLGNAIKNNDVQTVTSILGRMGVSLATPDLEQELLQRQ